MDSIEMLRAAAALLAISALGGLVMAGIRFARKVNPPPWLSMLHGILAAAALTLIAYAAAALSIPRSGQIALVLLLLAATGGVVLNLGFNWRRRLLPASIVIAHALLAIVGFGFLLLAAFVDQP
jgi:hypothetical protein